jgi:hypothetical protein
MDFIEAVTMSGIAIIAGFSTAVFVWACVRQAVVFNRQVIADRELGEEIARWADDQAKRLGL